MVDYPSLSHLLPGGQQQEEEKPFSYAAEVGRTVSTGITRLGQSLIDLPKIFPGVDYDYKLDPWTEKPQTAVGETASWMIQFAVPYAGALRLGSLAYKLARVASGLGKTTRVPKKALDTLKTKIDRVVPKPKTQEILHQQLQHLQRLRTKEIHIPPPQLTALQKYVKWSAAGAVADFIAFSPNDPNLSNWIKNLTEDKQIPVINSISELLATDENDSAALNRFRNVLEGLGLGIMVPVVIKGLGKGISYSGKGISAATPQPVKDVAISYRDAFRKKLDRGIEAFVASGQGFRNVAELAHEKNIPALKHVKRVLDTWQEYRMIRDAERQAAEAFYKGWNITNTSGNRERVPINHLSREQIERNVAKHGPEVVEKFKRWLYAIQGEQHWKTVKASSVTRREIDEINGEINSLPAEVQKTLYKAVEDLKDYNSAALYKAEHEGIIDSATRKNYEFVPGTTERRLWVPQLRKADTEAIELWSSIAGKSIRVPSKIKIARKDASTKDQEKLYEANIKNPLNDAYNNLEVGYSALVRQGIIARINRKLVDTINEIGKDGEKFATLKPKTRSSKSISGSAVKSMLNKAKVSSLEIDEDQMFRIYSSRYNIDDKTLTVWRNGKAELWDIHDPLLMQSLAAMGPQHMGDTMKFIVRFGGQFKNILTRLVTTAPSFLFSQNFTRDTLSVGILKKGFLAFVGSYRGLYNQLRGTPLAQEMEAAGGTFGNRAHSDFLTAREYSKNNSDRIFNLGGPTGWNKFMGVIDKFTQKFEMASRTEAYRLYRKEGFSQTVAAFKSREIAVDFAQHGSSTYFKLLTSTVPFLNAHIQGINRTLRALGAKKLVGGKFSKEEVEEVKRVWTQMMYLSTMAGVVLPMMHYKSEYEGVRETYEDVPRYLKDTNIVIVTPKVNGVNLRFFIPKPFDFGIIPTIVEKFLDEEFVESDAMVVREYIWDSVKNTTRFRDASLIPQIFRPWVEIAINKKFTDAPVVPQYLKGGGLAERRYWTRPTAIFLAEIAGSPYFPVDTFKSPLKIEHLLNSYLGTVGGFLMEYITDPVFRNMLELPDKPIEHPSERWPWEKGALGLGKFKALLPVRYKVEPPTRIRSENELYNAFNRANSIRLDFNSFKDGIDNFSRQHFTDMLKDPETRTWLILYPLLKDTLDELAKINSAIEDIVTLAPDQLEAKNELLKTRQAIAREMASVYFGIREDLSEAVPPAPEPALQEGMALGGLVTKTEDEIVADNQQVAVVDPLQLRPLQMYGDVPNPMEQGIIGGFGGGGRRQRQSEDKSNEVFTMHTETGEDVRPLVSGEFIQKSVHMSININGKEILVPTAWMVNGKRQVVENDKAIEYALEYEKIANVSFPRFDTPEEATKFSKERSTAGGVFTGPLWTKN